jgi:cytochrome c5
VANKQDSDTHFFNSFSLVLGILVAFAIVLFALARVVGGGAQARSVEADPLLVKKIHANIEPVAHVAIAGQDNSALAKLEGPAAAAPADAVPANGEQAYQKICSACHAQGVGGAPKIGDHAAWNPRIAQGKEMLYKHAIGGYQGGKGVMPPRGGTAWPDETIRAAVDHMVSLNK